MPRKSHLTTKDDVELLRWWREWLQALDAEMAAVDQRDEERRHKRVEMLQRTIATTPSEGVTGLGVKLALASFLDSNKRPLRPVFVMLPLKVFATTHLHPVPMRASHRLPQQRPLSNLRLRARLPAARQERCVWLSASAR
jgi:hypothetical protein